MKYITIHASATYPDMDIDIEWIRNIHVKQNGWSDVGYHYFIRRDGVVEQGRPEHITGAHVGNNNTGNLGVCLAGGLQRGTDAPEDNFTDSQYKSLTKLLTRFHKKYPEAEIKGHNEFPGYESRGCPCFDIATYRKWITRSWSALYLPDDWWKHNWKEGFDRDWNKVNIYKELPVKHKEEW